MIKKLSDLSIGETYYLCIVKDSKLAKKAKLLAFVNEKVKFDSEKTELYLDVTKTDKVAPLKHLYYAHEIGIGTTKLEAENNFGKFNRFNCSWLCPKHFIK